MWHTVLLVRADHLPQQVCRPPCGTLCCSCVLATFRNRCLGHHVAHHAAHVVLTTFRNRCLGHHVAHCAARAC